MRGTKLSVAAWWLLFGACLFYGLWALAMVGLELLFELGIVQSARVRNAPVAFIFHALFGALAVLLGPLQFRRAVQRKPALHRRLGSAYVLAALITSVVSLQVALAFDVSAPAKVVFGALCIAWFATTMRGWLLARAGAYTAHRNWMIRSFALTFFVVTFSIWVPLFKALPLRETVGYPLSVFLSWALNLAAAELIIRRNARVSPAREQAEPLHARA